MSPGNERGYSWINESGIKTKFVVWKYRLSDFMKIVEKSLDCEDRVDVKGDSMWNSCRKKLVETDHFLFFLCFSSLMMQQGFRWF